MNEGRKNLRFFAERANGIALAFVLIRSAAAHLGQPYYFLSTIYSYQIVGPEVGQLAAATLPAIQIAVAASLVLGWFRRGGYVVAVLLFLSFFAAQYYALDRGLNISCGCFGAGSSLLIGVETLALAGGCAVASLVGLILSSSSKAEAGTPCDTPTGTASP